MHVSHVATKSTYFCVVRVVKIDRRLHDRDMSGWFYLLVFIPYLGGLILFVITLLPGTPGENRYGDDPINPDQGQLDQVFR